jgi:starvation-inducible outer membrane lipoprotein
MKRVLNTIIFIMMASLLITGCGSTPAKTTNNEKPNVQQTKEQKTQQQPVKQEIKNVVEKDGLKFEAAATIDTVKGDRTADNVADDNGEYFANGSDIVKAADYKDVVVTVTADNKRDKTIDIGQTNWSAELSDGYKLEQDINLADMPEDVQIQPNHQGSVALHFIVKKDVDTKAIKLEYTLVKDEEKFQKLISESMNGGNEEELKSKYGDSFETFELEAEIK